MGPGNWQAGIVLVRSSDWMEVVAWELSWMMNIESCFVMCREWM